MEETKFCIIDVCDSLGNLPKTEPIKQELHCKDELTNENNDVQNLFTFQSESENIVEVLNEETSLKAEIIVDYREIEDDIYSEGEYLNVEDKILHDCIKLNKQFDVNESDSYNIETKKSRTKNKSKDRNSRTKHKHSKKNGFESTQQTCTKKKKNKSHLNTYICDICSKIYTRKCSLLLHINTHNGKSYKCEICGNTFTQKCHLMRHLKIHYGDKNFVCDVCKKRFSVRSSLVLHKRTHSKEKPHKCEVCETTFSQLCNLKRHMLIHSGEKPFQCEICDQRFRQKGDLDQHVRFHTGEKPYICRYCSKTFRTSSGCVTHMKKHHKK